MIPWFKKMAEISGGTFGCICRGLVAGKPRTHDYTSPCIKRALKQAGLSDRITHHRLRASFANILNKKGVPFPTIRKLMCHRRIGTTMIYIEIQEEEMRAAIDLAGWFKGLGNSSDCAACILPRKINRGFQWQEKFQGTSSMALPGPNWRYDLPPLPTLRRHAAISICPAPSPASSYFDPGERAVSVSSRRCGHPG